MTTQYTPILQLALPVTGELNGTWGDVVNDNITSMVEEAIAGLATISTWTTNAHTLTTADGVTDEARCAMLVLQTGSGGTALGGAGQVICPARTKLYVVKNDAAYAVTVKTSGGSGVAIAAGDTAFVFCDGTNVNACVTQIINGHITGNLTVDGNTTLGDASGDTVTINAGTTTVKTGGAIRFEDNAGGEYVAIKAPATVTATYTLTLPIDDGTNGQALITDGSGNLSWSTAASGDVYGPASATDNAVTRFDGTTGKLIQNSGVIIDDSNNVTGVVNLTSSGSVTLSGGTANGVAYLNGSKVLTTGSALTFDGTKLSVNASGTGVPFTVTSSGAGVQALGVYLSSGISYWGDSGGLNSMGVSTTSNFLNWLVNNSEQMRLTSTGLGIGTSSPSAKLHVKGGNNNSLIVDNDGSQYTSLYFKNNSGSNVSGLWWDNSLGGSYLFSSTFQSFYVNSLERMRIDSSGNLGLGVTPSAWGSGWVASQLGNFGGFVAGRNSNNQLFLGVNAYYNGTSWIYANTAVASRYYQSDGAHYWEKASSGTAGNAITFTQAMTLDASGNLNLGLTSGTARASIVGGALSTNNGVSISNGLTNGRLITGSGNVNSIHTYYGNEFLEVSVGSSHIVGTVYDGTYASPNMRFFTDSAERMRIDSSGNVGIGTSSPTGRLSVTAAASQEYGAFDAPTSGYAFLRLRYNGTGYANIGQGNAVITGGGATDFGLNAVNNMLFASGGITERMRLDSSGNLGLGVTPSAWNSNYKPFQIGATGSVYALTSLSSRLQLGNNHYNNSSNQDIYIASSTAAKYVMDGNIHYWNIAPSGTAGGGISWTTAMTLDASGNLGIGVTTIASASAARRALQISNGTSGGIIYLSNDGTESNNPRIFGSGSTQYDLGFAAGSSTGIINWYTNGTERMRIDSSGNVGIGTSSPSAKLEVGTTAFGSGGNSIAIFNASYGGVAYDTVKLVNATATVAGRGTGVSFYADNAQALANIYAITSDTADRSKGTLYISTYNGSAIISAGGANTIVLKTNATDRAILDSSGNLGLGTTPSAWGSSIAMQIRKCGIWQYSGTAGGFHLTHNAYYTGATYTYQETGYASDYYQAAGQHIWQTAPSGTAGTTASLTQAMTLDASGNLGVGTSSPITRLHVQGGQVSDGGLTYNHQLNSTAAYNASPITGTLVALQYNSSGSYAGMGGWAVGKENATDGNYSGYMAFFTRTHAGSTTERMRIDSSGNLLVGTTSASGLLTVARGAGGIGVAVTHSGDSGASAAIRALYTASTGTAYQFDSYFNGSRVGSITATSSATAYNTSSDYRLKENIQPMQNALATVAQLNPVTYTWKADGSDGQGFIAHELQAVVPDCVTGEKDAVDAEGNPVYQGIDTSFLVATLTKAIQELKAELDATKAEVAALKAN